MERPERLIIQAFEQAMDAGKIDWQRMTTAVLKNRMLVLTEGHGREILNVAGRELAQGFHWDVSHSASEASLGNSSETWRVKNAVTSTYTRTGIYAEETKRKRFILAEKGKPAKNRRALLSSS